MKRLTKAALGAAALIATSLPVAGAEDRAILEMATYSGCFICHQVKPDPEIDKPLAPSYLDIAARYQGDAAAFDRLLDRVMHGTIYREQVWKDKTSMRFMPPNVNVSRHDAATLVDWILKMDVDPAEVERLSRDDRMMTTATVSGCVICHRVDPVEDRRLIPLAPSFREIAARYKGDTANQTRLVESVITGTMEQPKRWPNVNMQFMPPNIATRKQDIEEMVAWILAMDTTGVQDRVSPQTAVRPTGDKH